MLNTFVFQTVFYIKEESWFDVCYREPLCSTDWMEFGCSHFEG